MQSSIIEARLTMLSILSLIFFMSCYEKSSMSFTRNISMLVQFLVTMKYLRASGFVTYYSRRSMDYRIELSGFRNS